MNPQWFMFIQKVLLKLGQDFQLLPHVSHFSFNKLNTEATWGALLSNSKTPG